jgi:hypothetical protein
MQSHALRFNVAPAGPMVFVQVGSGELSIHGLFGPPEGQIDVVSFDVPTADAAGNGVAVIGEPTIPIALLGFGTKKETNYVVTMDSSSGLVNTQTGAQIPFSDISWTSQDGEIPSGQFDGSPNQLLSEYNFHGNRAKGVVDYLTFSYANTSVYPSGTYRGRVSFTVTLL